MRRARIEAGLDPKSDASTSSTATGGTCWQDTDDPFYWDDPTGFYLPIFNGVYYTSSHIREDAEGAHIESTREFGVAVTVGCPDQLEEGDQITIRVSGAGTNNTYQIGDKYLMQVIAARPAYLLGGIDGNDTHTWGVVGTVAGPLADYSVVHGAELPYSAGGLGFTIVRGGINNALADRWNFDVLAGQFRWRKDAGAWSAATNITGGTLALSDGLNLGFTPNKAPSFVVGELYAWDVYQPYAPSEALEPDPNYGWRWSGTSAALTLALGSSQTLGAVAIVHRLPVGATLLLEGSIDGFGTVAWSEAITYRKLVIVALLSTERVATHIRLTVASATDGAVLWLWVGLPLQTAVPLLNYTSSREYRRTAGSSLRQSRRLQGLGYNAQAEFAGLDLADYEAVLALLDAAADDGKPMILTPALGDDGSNAPAFGWLGRDSLELSKFGTYDGMKFDLVSVPL
jgi:hypothetical protein